MLTVHVRINDATTSKPTPVRLRLLDEAGRYHPPFGRLAHFATGRGQDVGGNLLLDGVPFSYIDGACEVHLPPGPVTVEAHKGPEYAPLRRTVTLGSGQISLRLAIERLTDLRTEGWYSGDTRALFLSPHAALLESAAEDLALVNLLATETAPEHNSPAAMRNLLAFSGARPALEMPGHQVVVNTLNVHPVLGTVALLNCHRVVYPLRFGGTDHLDDWSLGDWCDQCHRKKTGLVVWSDLPRLTDDHPQGEALAALLLGKIDAFEVSRFDAPQPTALAPWYQLLNSGQRLPLVGGSGKETNTTALGAVRTYARLADAEPFSYGAWIEAVRTGRTFVTNGPLLTFTVNGHEPGAVLDRSAARPLRIRAEVRGALPVERLEILYNGTVVLDGPSPFLEAELPLAASGWLAARCRANLRLADGQYAAAHTSPIYLTEAGRPPSPDADSGAQLLAILERTSDWVQREARTGTESHRAHLLEILEAARHQLRPR